MRVLENEKKHWQNRVKVDIPIEQQLIKISKIEVKVS